MHWERDQISGTTERRKDRQEGTMKRQRDRPAFTFLSSHVIQSLSHYLDTVTVWTPAKLKDRDLEQFKLMCHHIWLSGPIVKSLCEYVQAMQCCQGGKGGFMVKGAYLSDWSSGIKCCRWQRLSVDMLLQQWASKPPTLSFSSHLTINAFLFSQPWESHTASESKWNEPSGCLNVVVLSGSWKGQYSAMLFSTI